MQTWQHFHRNETTMSSLSNLCVILLIFQITTNSILPSNGFEGNLFKDSEMSKLFACDFEVFGKVQGVFFRKYTEKQAKQLGINGWCRNTMEGTVKGQMEGPLNHVNEMKHWLSNVGSPKSRIEKAIFSEIKEIPEYSTKSFVIKR